MIQYTGKSQHFYLRADGQLGSRTLRRVVTVASEDARVRCLHFLVGPGVIELTSEVWEAVERTGFPSLDHANFRSELALLTPPGKRSRTELPI
jgi:hypothetical protein